MWELKSRVDWRRPEFYLAVLAASFVFVNALALSLALDGRPSLDHLAAPAVWLAIMSGSTYVLIRHRRHFDLVLLLVTGFLTGWGLVLLDRLASNFLWRQVLWLALAVTLMTVLAVVPSNLAFLRRYRYTWLFLGLALLGATFVLGVNPSGAGATLWLQVPLLGEVYFQPSELLKLLLLVYLASYFDERHRLDRIGPGIRKASILTNLAPLLLMWGFSLVLLLWQRDLGAAALFFVVFLILLYLATGEWRLMVSGFVLLLIAGAIGYVTFDVVALRIETWFEPWSEATGRGFQIVQSLYAVASGGLLGQGVGMGEPGFIPVVHTDFVFAAIAEEWGAIGSFGVTAALAVLLGRGMVAAQRARRPFDMYLAAGISAMIGIQTIMIVGGVTKVLPLTGVTLPLVSYGGSSLVVTAIMIGLLLNISSRPAPPYK